MATKVPARGMKLNGMPLTFTLTRGQANGVRAYADSEAKDFRRKYDSMVALPMTATGRQTAAYYLSQAEYWEGIVQALTTPNEWRAK